MVLSQSLCIGGDQGMSIIPLVFILLLTPWHLTYWGLHSKSEVARCKSVILRRGISESRVDTLSFHHDTIWKKEGRSDPPVRVTWVSNLKTASEICLVSLGIYIPWCLWETHSTMVAFWTASSQDFGEWQVSVLMLPDGSTDQPCFYLFDHPLLICLFTEP